MQHPTAGAMTVLSPPVKLDGDGFTPPAPRRPSAVRATRSWPISASPRHRSRRSSTRASRTGAGPRIDRRARRLDMIDIRRGPANTNTLGVRARWRVAGGGGAVRALRPRRAKRMRGGMRGGLDAACAPADRAGGGRPRRLFGRGGHEPARCGPGRVRFRYTHVLRHAHRFGCAHLGAECARGSGRPRELRP